MMMHTTADQIVYAEVPIPDYEPVTLITELPEDVYRARLEAACARMAVEGLDALAIYGDREHFSNFEYLCGFDPRFEEALLIVHRSGECFCLLGNECYPLASISKIPLRRVLFQPFSLPGQPISDAWDFAAALANAGLKSGMRVGLVDWKLFPKCMGRQFGAPSFIANALCACVGDENLVNATGLLINPENGLRIVGEWEQAVAYESSAALISQGMLRALDAVEPGKTELEIGAYFNPCALPVTSHANVSSGARTRVGLISPTNKVIERGDRMTMCWSIRGALSCRSFYVAESEADLPEKGRDYIDCIVKPYYASIVNFYENIGIGVTGGELHEVVTRDFPQEQFGWTLNPGHLLGSEEWLCSPVWKDSPIRFCSGQFVQVDFIPGPKEPYFGSNVEDGILIADEALREKIRRNSPDTWRRIERRRRFMADTLGIRLKDEVLPLYDGQGLLRPFVLNRSFAMRKR